MIFSENRFPLFGIMRVRGTLDGAQIFGGGLAGPAVSNDVESDFLAFVKSAHAGAFDRADMNEDVVTAVFRLDEAEALLVVEPLHSTRIHGISLSLTVYAWEMARDG
jgi:hypothetical protein